MPAATSIFIKPTSLVVGGLNSDYSIDSTDIFNRTINGNGLSNAALVNTGSSYLSNVSLGPTHSFNFSGNTGRYNTSANAPNVQGQGSSFTTGLNFFIDLGAAYEIQGMWLWNYMEGADSTLDRRNRGFDSISVEFSSDGVVWNNKQTVTPSLARVDGYAEELLFTGDNANTRYLRFSEFSTFGTVMSDGSGSGPGANRYAGMSEIRFIGNVPEPTQTLLLSLAGFLAFFRRSR